MWSLPAITSSESSPEKPPVDWGKELAEHERWLRTVVYARTQEGCAVDEVMQEVALAAISQKSPLQDRSKVAPWLYQVAVRQSLLYRRACGRRKKRQDHYAKQREAGGNICGSTVVDGPLGDPLDWLLKDETRRLIRQALDELTPKDAELLLLKYTENWSYRLIAGHLGISESVVETRLFRARKKMRTKLVALSVIEVSK
ncbi:MAG: RNA polymerase sigma factor [Pirellulaceae bacterium]|nr:RNA polymerase sigma factor [Pirellulaceae bacterium]